MHGWIKLHRQLLEWEWYDDVNTFRLFIHLILKANHKERKYKGVTIKIGQLMTGRKTLSIETGLSEQKIRTSLSRLESTNEITIKSNSQGTIIQVVNYEKYQVSTNDSTNDQPASNQQVTTNNNDKNEENDIINNIYNLYPPKCVVSSRSSGKGKKNKEQIKKLLKNGETEESLIKVINWYVADCKKTNTYMKNFQTFLNNLPEIDETPVVKPRATYKFTG